MWRPGRVTAYHDTDLAMAQYRTKHYGLAQATFEEITRNSLHIEWNESILWELKLMEMDLPERAHTLDLIAVTGAHFCWDETDTFNNANQRELRSKVFYYAGHGALRAGDEGLAKLSFSPLPTTDPFYHMAARCLLTR